MSSNIIKQVKLIGTRLNTNSEFRDSNNVKVIPSTVNFKYKTPSGELINTTVSPINNIFSANILLDIVGDWYFRWECSGDYASADEFTIHVQDTLVK